MTTLSYRYSSLRSLSVGLALCGAALVASSGASQAVFVFGLQTDAPASIVELVVHHSGFDSLAVVG
jgi:hypothetical protein